MDVQDNGVVEAIKIDGLLKSEPGWKTIRVHGPAECDGGFQTRSQSGQLLIESGDQRDQFLCS